MFDIINSSGTRIKTGIALIVAFLMLGLVDSFFITWLVFGILMMISVYESMKLFKIDDSNIYTISAIIWLLASFFHKPEDLIFIVAIIFASKLAYTKQLNQQLLLPLIYPVVSFLFLLSLYNSFGMVSLLWLVAIVAGADIGAYFVGRSIGKTSFCSTSPNKTIEGVIGGVVVASILGVVFALDDMSLFTSLIISAIVAVSSVFGDLFESYLKREAGVKDSGNILPGHGGILDRTDGYLFGAVIMLTLLRLIG